MPRLQAAEFDYSGAMEDCYNDYVTTMPPPPTSNTAVQPPENNLKAAAMPSDTLPKNASATTSYLCPATNVHDRLQQQQIHTISSSDEDEFALEPDTTEEKITNISSDECEDFEGFDDTTPKNSGLFTDSSQKDLNVSSSYLKRHFNEYEDSKDAMEAIEVDDDEQISVEDNGREAAYMTKDEITPKKEAISQYEPDTPNKRKKLENDSSVNATSFTHLKTPPDQIVEINSDSTTNSLKQKRQQINTKFQLNLSQQQQQNHKFNNYPNKCSTESTSEFPVSSPSNPQQPRGGKYPPRPPMLKNTLPADSFERQLAMITACNPQMTLAEKIQSWDCDEELSDVEDVNIFDEQFKCLEKQKKSEIKKREKGGRIKNIENKNYDFLTFRQMILSNMKEQSKRKFNPSGQGGSGGTGVLGSKCIETSGSESSKSLIHVDDRPSTSAVAQQQLQQRRTKPVLNLETGEPKKRLFKEAPKRNQNSTTPPQTSSSDNERDFFRNSRQHLSHSKLNSRQMPTQDKLCPSSSEEAISQDIPTHVLMKTNNKCTPATLKNLRKRSPIQQPQTPTTPSAKTNDRTSMPKNSRVVTEEEIDSVFRLHRLNRERDKINNSPWNDAEEQPTSIIQMRLDCANDNKIHQLIEKKQDFFKTPIIPQKYLANSTVATENQRQNSLSPTKNIISDEIGMANEMCRIETSLQQMEDIKNDIHAQKLVANSDTEDLDGVYHQQHEFCNYLGLTGMSTATAMANAVAELAQCNLARRSMRVLRQQQQERRDKTAKEERQLESFKMKLLKDERKRERGGREVANAMETEFNTGINSEECSHSQTPEQHISLKEPKKKTCNNPATKSLNAFTIIKKVPEIKILCHIAGKNRQELEILSTECIKKITQPIRESLMRQTKQQKLDEELENEEIKLETNKNQTENINEIDNKVTLIKSENMSVCRKEIQDHEMESPKRSSQLSFGKTPPLKLTRSQSQIHNELKEIVKNPETNTISCKQEPVNDTVSVTKSLDYKTNIPCLKEEYNTSIKLNTKASEIDLSQPGIHLLADTPSIIQQKLQMALEESRKSKPSIFIVQSLECKKEQLNFEDDLNDPTFCNRKEIHKGKLTKISLAKSLKATASKLKKNNLKNILKSRAGKNYPTFKRQLRKRKIIVIKSLKSKQNSYNNLNEIKRELRSSPKINMKSQKPHDLNVNKKELNKQNKKPTAKSFRTVHTETNDLESYLDKHITQTKTRLMAKASALLERSRRMTLRGGNNGNLTNNKSKIIPQLQRVTFNMPATRRQLLTDSLETTPKDTNEGKLLLAKTSADEQFKAINKTKKKITMPAANPIDNENVVVSSTTNTYDERLCHEPSSQSNITLKCHDSKVSYVNDPLRTETKDQSTQCQSNSSRIQYLNTVSLQTMRNPLKSEYGNVLHIYYELDVLIVIQERLVSFWKCSKLLNILTLTKMACRQIDKTAVDNFCNNQLRQPSSSSILLQSNACGEWIQLGELRRLNVDFEISVPYANRICLHNSTPIYLEMRARQLPKNQRDCNLLSMYINIYYYHDDDMIAKCNSISLDTIQSDINLVNYTTLIDSRYFMMTWPQENHLGKTRSGLCKYSLTPQLDTLASIRDFKSMRHTIRYLECLSDDKLIGFGETQVTIWDHRSGDVLMNFDLELPMGKNLGSVYFSSQDIEQNNMLILHQYRDTSCELRTIACAVTHTQPSYRILQEISLPMPAFKVIKSAINSGDHLVVTGGNDDELWISTTNPKLITLVKATKNNKIFYNRQKSQLVELTEKTLNVNTLANHILQLAAGLDLN